MLAILKRAVHVLLAWGAVMLTLAAIMNACATETPRHYIDYPDDGACAGPRSFGC